ncbi:MAG: polymerase [Paenibacillus sp.]|nr:polymerase [Paenibacillus sp.]
MASDHAIEQWINLTISEDRVTALLSIPIMAEPMACTLNDLVDYLGRCRVKHGVKQGILQQIAENPRRFAGKQIIVAEGEPPVSGKDGEITMLHDPDVENKKPMENEDGTVDFKEISRILNVRKGQLIAERLLAENGKPGKAVTGEVIEARNGKEARFKIGKNVVTDADQLALYAAIDGMITITDRGKINVFPIYEVNGDVDYRIGNIDFFGTVVIRGNVLPGFKIKSAGDIRVTGGVESAELEAVGSIEITAGILGHNKGIIRAGVNVKSAFIQDAQVETGQDIIVTQSIMHSQIRAGRNVICKGAKGLIIGGTVQAGEKVVARTVGNTMSTPTSIEVGVLPELRNELTTLRSQLRAYADNLDKTDKALVLLDQMAAAGQLSPDRLAMRIKLSHTRKQTIEEQAASKERILEIERTLEDTDKARVEVVSIVYGGTKIVIGRYTRFVKEAAPRVYFKYLDGDIAMLPNS